MMESAEDRPCHDPHVPWEMMVADQGRGQSRRCLRQARTEAGVRAPAVIMELPDAKNPPQMILPERSQEVQTLATETAEEALTIGVRRWRPDWRPEDADTHRSDGGVEPRRVDAVPIVEEEAIGVRGREGFPELLHGPHRGRMTGDVDVEQSAAPDLHRHEHVQHPE